MPEEAKEFSADGYEAFVEYWFEAHDYGTASGDSQPLEEVSNEKCGFCLSRISEIAEFSTDGQWTVGADVDATSIAASMVKDNQDLYAAPFKLEQAAGTVYRDDDGATSTVQEIEAAEFRFIFFAYYSDSEGWEAAAVNLDEG